MDSAVFTSIVRKNVVFAIRSEQERIFRKETLAKLSQKITSSFLFFPFLSFSFLSSSTVVANDLSSKAFPPFERAL